MATKKAAPDKAPRAIKASLSGQEIIDLIEMFVKNGVPAIVAAIDSLKALDGPDFGPDEIRGFLEGIELPEPNP